MNRYFYWSIIFLCHVFFGFSQTNKFDYDKIFFNKLSIHDGLSQNTVNCIFQDRKGFMWFSTKDGLNRYDGSSFQVYKKDINGLGNSFITEIFEDKNSNLWIGTDAGVYIYYPEKESFEYFSYISCLKSTKIEKNVKMIDCDNNSNIWVAVESQGMFYFDMATNTLENYIISDNQINANVECFAFDKYNTFWIGSFGDGLYYSKDKLTTTHPFISASGKKIFEGDVITKIMQGPYNYLYVSSVKGGLKEIDLLTNTVKDLLPANEDGEHIYIRDFIFNNPNDIWIGTESGLIIYNIQTGNYWRYKNSFYDVFSISDNALYSLYKDREGGIWIGTYFNGINYYSKRYSYFEKYYPQNKKKSIQSKRVREFCAGNDGTVWIGTEDGGLNNFDPQTKTFKFFEPSKNFTNIHGLCMDGDNLWIGTFMNGLKVLNTKTGALKHYKKGTNSNSLNDNNIFTIYKTRNGSIYLGTLFGLQKYNAATDDFSTIPQIGRQWCYDIKEDSFGDLWVASSTNGLYRLEVHSGKWMNYVYDKKQENSLSYNKVVGVFEDSKRQIWVSTQGGGFCRYNRDSNDFKRYSTSLDLGNEVIYQIIEDNNEQLWISTNNGLICFNPISEETKCYTVANGLLTNQFNYRSSFKDRNGKIYFGCIEGFIAFDPNTFSENKQVTSVTFTDFLIHNKKVPVGTPGSPLKKSITYSDTIELSYSQNSFSLRLTPLSYDAPQTNQIMYLLEGFDKEWCYITEVPIITYSNLHHGNYILKAKASNSDGVWSDEVATLHIRIHPPFYFSVWAYCIYFLLFISVSLYVIWYIKKRNESRQKQQLETFERNKEREIYNAKIDFFTNLAHEIRTPLTLIKGPLESVLMKKDHAPEHLENLDIMNRNTDRLLSLVNQLLDFRKTETKGFMLNFIECNISDIIRETYKRFTPLFKQQNIEFKMELPEKDFYAHIDKEAFIKILSNLFNNAIKYCSSSIDIKLENQQAYNGIFCIKVVNDGLVVPKKYREEIFKPFFQFHPEQAVKTAGGTGIGLALARSLAELHQGSLYMENRDDKNSFCLTLPCIQDLAIKLHVDTITTTFDAIEKEQESSHGDQRLPTILLVEDNSEMLLFIKKQLKQQYQVITASNGKKALEILDENSVDLIISDVLMPEMDGFELCETVKSNIIYSHIPVVLLTAKTNIQSKIEGLELGADAYIEKPFSVEYLLANVVNLIQNREKLKQAFANFPFITANTIAQTKADEEFLNKLINIIQQHLEDPEFSMDTMAEKLNMSRASFYRKIKGIISLNPNEYLRLERLKKAAQLLKDGEYQINEICYMVGFSSPSYFAKCFLKQFGVLPKDFGR